MAASSSHFTKKINRYKLLTFSLLLILSLFCFLFFNKGALDPKLRDLSLISQIPFPLTVSRPPHSHDEFDAKRQQPNSVSSTFEEKADANVTASSKFSEPESPEDRNVEKTEPVSSKSDLDVEPTHKTSEPSLSSEEDSGERRSEPESSNEVPISSNSNLEDKAQQKTSEPLDPSEPELSNEEKIALITLEDDKNSTKSEESGVKMESFKEGAGFIDNAVAEKLRNCDMYNGKWVKDEGYPLYRAGSCPYVDEAFDCQSNGRPDFGYTQWRWKPHGCELPRFFSPLSLSRL